MRTKLEAARRRRQDSTLCSDDGFTLIELLVVVVIIGILIAIAIPLYLNYQKGANDKSAQSDVRGAVAVLEQCKADNAAYPSGLTAVGSSPVTGYTACANQTIKVSGGTTVTYTSASPYSSFMIVGTNSNGSGKSYCYNSATAGSVKSATSC